MANVLLRFVDPEHGHVTVGGVALSQLDPAQWRTRVAWVPQQASLFHGTVADNLRLARPDASDDDLVAAATAANAHGFVTALPDGYATPVGEGGARLSGGERQRLALARAFLKDAPFVILDADVPPGSRERDAGARGGVPTDAGPDRARDRAPARAGGGRRRGRHPPRGAGRRGRASRRAERPGRPDRVGGTGVTPTPLRRLLRLAAPVRGWLLLALLASFGALAANIALMAAAPYLISRATLVAGFAALSVAVTAVRAFAIARVGLRYSERYVVHVAALRILTEIRVWLFRAIEPLAPGGLGGFRSGDLLARTVADVDSLDAFFVRGLVPPVAATLAVAFAARSSRRSNPRWPSSSSRSSRSAGSRSRWRRAAAPVARPSVRSRPARSCTPG